MTLQRRGVEVSTNLRRFAPLAGGALLLLASAGVWAAPAGPDVLLDDARLFTAAVAEHKGKLCLTSFEDAE